MPADSRDQPIDLAGMRVGYGARQFAGDTAGADGVSAHLDDSWLTGDPPWLELFSRWLGDVVRAGNLVDTGASGYIEANAMVLGTVDAAGRPQTRTVLCKGADADGIVFFTGYESAKGRALQANPYASATFAWINLERQVHFRGPVRRISAELTEAYWNSRPRGSQLSAFASAQSEPIGSRAELQERAAAVAAQFSAADGERPVPVPPQWGGYLLCPESVEFWQGRADRLHNRVRAVRADDGVWRVERLQP